METKDIISAVAEFDKPGRRAVALAYYLRGYGARVRGVAGEFHTDYSPDPATVTGDYVSDLAAELTEYVSVLSALVAELDKVRAELDAASFPAVR